MSDTFRPSSPDGQPADSRVPLESGVPPARGAAPTLLARGEAHAAAALSACTRAEANLGALLRSVQHVAASIASAREAKADVVQELQYLRELLTDADEEQLTLRHRVVLLEQALDRSEREGARARAFLLHEQDTFIAGLLDEHAHELAELRRRLTSTEQTLRDSQDESQALATNAEGARREAEELSRRLRRSEGEVSRLIDAGKDMRETLLRLQVEREEAQVLAAQAGRERDQLRAELARLRSGVSAANPESARMTAARVDRELEAPRSPSQMGAGVRRSSIPPEELRAAITDIPEPSSLPASSSPAGLKQKPDPSTRPLIGYSLSGDLPEERIVNPRPSSRPPR